MDFNRNYFEIFGLPVSFQMDLDLLADRYLALQKEIHPDNFAAGSDHEKRLSMQWATLINTANETLKNPLARAIYMLEMNGMGLAENPTLPPAFLMKQIELREELEELEQTAQGDSSLEGLDVFKGEVREIMRTVEGLFNDAIGVDAKKAEEAAYELQFLNKLLVAADHLEEKLLDY